MRLSHILHLGVKELRSLARDRVMLLMIAYSFSLAIYAAATAMPDALNRATIAIVDEDGSPLSHRIASAFYPPYFVPPDIIDRNEMDRRLDSGDNTFALDIPPNFQRDVLAGRQPVVQLNVDATRMSQAFTGGGYIQNIVTQEVQSFLDRYRSEPVLPVDLAYRIRFNPQLSNAWFGSVIEVINNVTMLSIILTGAALIREREHGTIEHLLVMPVTPFEIMMSKVWAMAVIVLLAALFSITVIVQHVLSVPIQGSLALFMAGTVLHLFAATSMGIFLGTVARSMPQLGLLMILVLLPLQMLSGGMTPRESMPDMVQNIMLIAPTTHFVEMAQAILFRGAGMDVVWPQFTALLAIGGSLFGLSLARFRKTISAMA